MGSKIWRISTENNGVNFLDRLDFWIHKSLSRRKKKRFWEWDEKIWNEKRTVGEREYNIIYVSGSSSNQVTKLYINLKYLCKFNLIEFQYNYRIIDGKSKKKKSLILFFIFLSFLFGYFLSVTFNIKYYIP